MLVKQEEFKEGIPKRETDQLAPSADSVHVKAYPSVVLTHRSTPGSQSQESIPPIHTYNVRHADNDDFKRRGLKRACDKENLGPAKQRKT